MRYSEMFLPTVREIPSDAEVTSHQLMIRAGMVRKLTSGIYSYLPLGYMVIRKVEQIIREEMTRAGAQEVFLPTVQPAELWQESAAGFITERNSSASRTGTIGTAAWGRPTKRSSPILSVARSRRTGSSRRISSRSRRNSATRSGRASASCAAVNSA